MTELLKKKELTGRKFALILCAGFATVTGANFALIYSAIGSFPGLETREPYVESLNFESRRIAQEKLNWTSSVAYEQGQLKLTLLDEQGKFVVTPKIALTVGRATSASYDMDVELYFDGHDYVADMDIPAGNWQAKIKATALDGTPFSRSLSLYIRAAK